MGLYKKYILPRLINLAMRDESNANERANLVPRASGVVLEIGFGSGLNLPFYTAGITKLYALDPSKELLNLARERVKKVSFPIEFLAASAEKIPLRDDTVDTVVTTWTLCSIPRPEQALREAKRVLRAGGKFIFIEHGWSPEKNVARWQNRLNPIWKVIAGGCQLNRKIDDLLAQADFEIIELKKEYQKRRNHKPKILNYLYKGVAKIK